MPTLLLELAERRSAENQWAAARLDAEIQSPEVPPDEAPPDARRQTALTSARQATDYALAQLAQAEDLWRSALADLAAHPTGDRAEQLLRTLLGVFDSGTHLIRSARALWQVPERLGAAPERLDVLAAAEVRFREMAGEARAALGHRASGWQPADPGRLAEGLKQARAGQTVSADQARTWFRRG